MPEIRPGLLQGYLPREALLNSLVLLPATAGGRLGGVRARRGRRPQERRAAWHTALDAGDARMPTSAFRTRPARSPARLTRRSPNSHTAPVPAAAPHAHGRRPLDLHRQGPLQAHASVRRAQGADLHARRTGGHREGWLVSVGPHGRRLGMGADSDRDRARASRRDPRARRGLWRKPQRLQRPLAQRRRAGPDHRRRRRCAPACRARVPRRPRGREIRAGRRARAGAKPSRDCAAEAAALTR